MANELMHLKVLRLCFDEDFYSRKYLSSSLKSTSSPWKHFINIGFERGYDPNPFTHLCFLRNLYPLEPSNLASLSQLMSQKIFHNALLAQECRYMDLKNAADTNNTHRLDELLIFDVVAYISKQDNVRKASVAPIRHLFEYGIYENRFSSFFDLRNYNTSFDNSLSDYINLMHQRRPLSMSSLRGSPRLTKMLINSCDFPPEYTFKYRNICIGLVFYKNSDSQASKILNSIQQNADEFPGNLKLMIYDNDPGSTNYSIANSLHFQVIQDPGNCGFSLAHNSLMMRAFSSGCDLYVGLNPDGWLLPNALQDLLAFLETKRTGFLVELNTLPLAHPKWYDILTGETDWASGVAFAMDSSCFYKTQGFDPSFPMYCEDVDLSYRARLGNNDIYVTTSPCFYHDVVHRSYIDEGWRKLAQLVGEWYLCRKWKNDSRALIIEQHIRDIDPLIQLPKPQYLIDETSHFTSFLLTLPRYARSRFWT